MAGNERTLRRAPQPDNSAKRHGFKDGSSLQDGLFLVGIN